MSVFERELAIGLHSILLRLIKMMAKVTQLVAEMIVQSADLLLVVEKIESVSTLLEWPVCLRSSLA